MKSLQYYITVIPAVLIAISFHEMSHAYTAYLLGDRTAKSCGRLSFNPLSHIDPIGFLCMVMFGFGWAKPVPINPGYFKNPKAGMAITALAGPVSNFFMALVSIVLYTIIFFSNPGKIMSAFASFLSILASLNIGLGVFNLLPIPPLDGSKIAFMFLPNRVVGWFYHYEGYIRLGLFVALYLGLLDGIIGWGQSEMFNLFLNIGVKICSIIGLI